MNSRAVVLTRLGSPVSLETFAVPKARPGQMTVKVELGGICGTDVHLQAGDLSVPLPLVLGHEGIGTVVELGDAEPDASGHNQIEVGSRVMWASSISCGKCRACVELGEPTLCPQRATYGINRSIKDGEPLSGSWADMMCLQPRTSVFTVPPEIPSVAAMALACAGPTAVHALVARRPVARGETVIVQGSGPVGLACAALCQLAGAAATILVGGPESRLRLAREAGIGDHHINRVEADDAEAALANALHLTPQAAGADLVIECTGVPGAIDEGMRLARRGGTYVVLGQYADSGPAQVTPHLIVHRQLTVLGSWGFAGTHLGQYLERLPELQSRFDLQSLVSVSPLSEANGALDAVRAGAVMKAVLAT